MRTDRIVVDTNVLISAALQSTGRPRAAVDAVARARGLLLFSEATLAELSTRLDRAKFDRYVTRAARTRFVEQVRAVAEWVEISGAPQGCRDPDDDKFLETALVGQAGCIVTGDQDLLVLSPFHHVLIVTPAAFLEGLGA
ncbi:MAG: putative toxin-antitoxin system toxin component, PIN family [Myxococcota bacterium]